jgi:FAD/FMN-containing dehydrogenase/Fe-S oxidoreductase
VPTAPSIRSRRINAVQDDLAGRIAGEVRADNLARTLYASDASIYEITPDLVVLPRSVDDIVLTVQACAKHGVPITARGAGTGLTGGAVNRGVQLDCARYLTNIGELDAAGRTIHVEAGVVLDELNAHLKPHGLHFAPDVATSSRATIGGMIANNSCGAHSILYGRTVDHIKRLDVVLADGTRDAFGPDAPPLTSARARAGDAAVTRAVTDLADEIAARYPKVLRSNGGYALDRVQIENGRARTERLISGSEGTLAIIVGATLNLEPLPRHTGLLVVCFDTLGEALRSVPPALEHQPAAIELIDNLILQATEGNPAMARRRWFVDGQPAAIIACEMFEDDPARLEQRLEALRADLTARAPSARGVTTTDPARQDDVWTVRKAGLGLLMSRPGIRQPYAFIEDAAVGAQRLPAYIEKLDAFLASEGVTETGHYAHASVGCLHVRPVLDLRDERDIARMKRIADGVSSLVLEFGGTMTGEHGDGIVRSAWHRKMYGPRIVHAFRQIKNAFDPDGLLNPGKIVDPLPMTENLRQGAGYQTRDPDTILDFSLYGGMAGLAGMCSGVGQCRQRLVGTMCPSYMATNDETHTTRGRANALRVALSNRGLLDGLDDPALADVMDLCLSCKACKTECPTGTDMAKLKAEWLSHQNTRHGVPARSRLIATSIEMAAWGCHFAPLSNWVMQSRVVRVLMEHLYGLDRRVPPPRFARQTFRQWHATQPAPDLPADAPEVVYFCDTWTNFYTPQVGRATIKVLTALGCRVRVPPTSCCGRPLISKGLLAEARQLAEQNVRVLAPYADRGVPIVGTEPSCISVLTDEFAQFVRNDAARRIAASALTIEAYVAARLREKPDALRFRAEARPLIYHGHCHQKALYGTSDAVAILDASSAGHAREIDSGCCGMAGAFGHEKEHYDVARAVGEQRLFPAIRQRGTADVIISGFSCRHHIEHHTGVAPRHVIEALADALEP